MSSGLTENARGGDKGLPATTPSTLLLQNTDGNKLETTPRRTPRGPNEERR